MENDKNQQEAKRLDVKAVRDNMELIDIKDRTHSRKLKYDDLGMCAKCTFLHAETTQYGTKRHWCTELHRKLSTNDPIVDCTTYCEDGQMSLTLMMGMATPIEAKRHRQAGFILDEAEEWECEDFDIMRSGRV